MKLIAQLRRLFKLQVLRVLHHLRLKLMNFLLQRFWRQRQFSGFGICHGAPFSASFRLGFRNILAKRQNIDHFLVKPLRHNAVLFVIRLLFLTTAFGFANRLRHRRRDFIAVENRFAVHVTRRAANRLDKRTFGAQEALFVGIENSHQRHFRHVQPLTKQVDTHQHVELAKTQIADNLHTLHGVDIRVQIAHFLTVLFQIFG